MLLPGGTRSFKIYLLATTTLGIFTLSHAFPLRDEQNSPQSALGPTHVSSYALQVTNHDYLIYTIPISLGNPPQEFTAAVDLGCSDMFVPSVECSEPQACKVHPLYNSTLSSSYQEDGRSVHVNHVFFYTRGNASRDSLHVGNIEVLEQTFEEATTLRPVYFYDDTSYDTPFGLSREVVISEDSSLQTQSAFQNMMAQDLLVHNAFSLKLPQSKDDFGTLTIGGSDEQYNQVAAAALPVVQRLREGQDEPYPSGGWQVEAISLSFDTGHERIHYDLRGHVATFSTVVPLLDLPASFSSLFKNFVGVDRDSGSIDCDKANSETLPNLEISLKGVGDAVHRFDFTPADYVRSEPRLPFMEPGICYVPIIEHEDSNVPRYISLGSLFLRKYYSTFDADALTITLNKLLDACKYCERLVVKGVSWN